MKIQRKWKFVLVVVFAIVLLLVARACGSANSLTAPESAARKVLAPFSAVGEFFSGFFDFDTKKNLEKELQSANEELAKLKTESSLTTEVITENERLRKLLDLKKSYTESWDMCVASITGRELDNWYERFTIDKGSADGIEENMAVVNEDGLIGRTINVTTNSSEVLLIIDAQGSLGGMTQESRIPGVLTGIGGGKGLLNMTNLPFNAETQLNDVVVTSGEGGIFPPGLLVGSVVKMNNSLDGLSKVAIIEPFCNFDAIKEVLVLIPRPLDEKEKAKTSEKDKADQKENADTSDTSDTSDSGSSDSGDDDTGDNSSANSSSNNSDDTSTDESDSTTTNSGEDNTE